MKGLQRGALAIGMGLVGASMLVAPTAAGAAKRPATSAKVVGTVKIDAKDPSVAYVLAQYRCTVADPIGNPSHLWVSVKQNDAGTRSAAVSAEGSGGSGAATRWEDSHRNPVTCDGKTHTSRFTVDQVEGKANYKTLTKGLAWVQFCLFDDTTPKGNGTTDFGQPVSSMVWKHVH
jgi:hypothetical protein